MTINKRTVVEEIFDGKFIGFLYNMLETSADDYLSGDPEEYGGKWDPNPYCVEPQLASGSGCYEYPDWAFDKTWERAKESMSESWDYIGEKLPDYMPETKKVFEENNLSDIEWLYALLDYLLDNDLKDR